MKKLFKIKQAFSMKENKFVDLTITNIKIPIKIDFEKKHKL